MICNLSPGDNVPHRVNVVIEIPLGSNVKYEFDREMGVIRVDRVLYTSMVYPFNYGFIPGSLEEDGDPLDVLVISNQSLYPGVIIEVRPIGVFKTEDEEGIDRKIIAVPVDKIDPTLSKVSELEDLPEIVKLKIAHFYEHYKEIEPNKWVKIAGWGSSAEAKAIIIDAINRYNMNKKA